MASDLVNCVEKSTLYVVATPIGNLKDITLRALDVLKNVDLIAAEDTRTTSILLEKYDISTKLISYHKYSDLSKCEKLIELLEQGNSIALVSDAGTPLISDPGNFLVELAIKNGFKVVPVVGASALIGLLSATSRQDEDFKFIGFIERNKNQIIETIKKNNFENLIFYESPNRLISTLEIISEVFPKKRITVARELTKKFEEIITDDIINIIEHFKNNVLKGEIAVLAHKSEKDKKEDFEIEEKIQKLKKLNLKDKEISSILASLYDLNKNDIYKLCIKK